MRCKKGLIISVFTTVLLGTLFVAATGYADFNWRKFESAEFPIE